MYFSPLPCHLVPLRPKYSPQHPILKHPKRGNMEGKKDVENGEVKAAKLGLLGELWGTLGGVLKCDASSLFMWFPTFRSNVSPS
jgi:hypothetical protein